MVNTFAAHSEPSLLCICPNCVVLAAISGGFNHSSVLKAFTVLPAQLCVTPGRLRDELGVVSGSALCFTPGRLRDEPRVTSASHRASNLFTKFSHPLMLWVSVPDSSGQKYEFSKSLSLSSTVMSHSCM